MIVSEEELKVIEKIKEKKEISFEELMQYLQKDKLERLIETLKQKNLIDVKKETKKIYFLSEEGKEYLSNGLPERNVLNLIKNGITNVGELTLKYSKAEIGIIWLKNEKLINILKGEIELTNEGKKYLNEPLEKEIVLKFFALEKSEDEVKQYEKYVNEFLKRNILNFKEVKKRIIVAKDEIYREKFEISEEIGALTVDILLKQEWKTRKFKKFDFTTYETKIAKKHPYNQILSEIRQKLIALGFKEYKGPIIESMFWNCDALFMPSEHPAREIHSIFYVKTDKKAEIEEKIFENVKEMHEKGNNISKGWGGFSEELSKKYILRSQNTAISARVLYLISKGIEKIPLKMFVIDRVFRPDVIDAKHFIEFDQLEGIIIEEDANFSVLLNYLKEIALALGAKSVKFKPAYFPFTEPSVELFVEIKGLGLVEVGGAGIFRPEVTKPFGIDLPVLAWGIGISRLAMIKMNVNDIRYLMSPDIKFLETCQP